MRMTLLDSLLHDINYSLSYLKSRSCDVRVGQREYAQDLVTLILKADIAKDERLRASDELEKMAHSIKVSKEEGSVDSMNEMGGNDDTSARVMKFFLEAAVKTLREV